MHFRLSHKARTAIRSSKRSWLITTASMHTWWSRQEWNQCKTTPSSSHRNALYLAYPKYPPLRAGTVSVRSHTTASLMFRPWLIILPAKWTTITSPIYCMRSYASINRKRLVGHDASRGERNMNITLRACQWMYPCHDLGSGECKLHFTSHESVITLQNTLATTCTTSSNTKELCFWRTAKIADCQNKQRLFPQNGINRLISVMDT
jgi:hypothetical protein